MNGKLLSKSQVGALSHIYIVPSNMLVTIQTKAKLGILGPVGCVFTVFFAKLSATAVLLFTSMLP